MTKAQFSMTRDFSNTSRLTGVSCFLSLRHWTLVIASLLVSFPALAAAEPVSPEPALLSRFGNLPLYFEANRGQSDAHVDYFARGKDHTVYLHRDGVTIALSQNVGGASPQQTMRRAVTNSATVRFVRMTLMGASDTASPGGLEERSGRVNYLIGNDPSQWQRGVPTFGRIQYSSTYEGVDVVYYGNNQELEYDFVIAPRADASVIKFHFDGAERLEVDRRGELVLHVGASELRQRKPVAYQTIDGRRRDVAVSYRLLDKHTVAFALGQYDDTKPLVIDPILSYSTYFGGGKGDIGWAIAVDSEGRAYIAGDTLSVFSKLPTSGEQPAPGGGTKYGGDAFVTRLDFDETNQSLTLGYLTYLGGNGIEAAIGIAVDAVGAAYITGYTTSSNFPALPFNVFQPNQAGDILDGYNSRYSDAFVTKLDATGQAVYSSYLGGELGETGADIAVDATGAAYVVGFTDSVLTFLVTNRLETFRCTNGLCGASKSKTNITTVSLLVDSYWVTNRVIPRRTKATDTNLIEVRTNITLLSSPTAAPIFEGFPIVNAIQTNNHTFTRFGPRFKRGTGELLELTNLFTGSDLFITKIAPDGLTKIYSTYLGGTNDDVGTGIGVALDGSVSVSGWTTSIDFPVTNAIQSEPGGLREAIVAKLNPAGDALVFSTYLGGRANDTGYRLAVDADGATYVTGATASPDFPGTPGSLGRGGIFTSTNSTGDWSLTSSGLDHPTIHALLADPFHPGTLYAGTPRGVFKSTDSGTAWTAMNTGLLSRTVNTLAIEPLTGAEVFAGTSSGLQVSTNGGLLWNMVEPELGALDVRSVLFDAATGTNLFAGTSSGVYARETFPVTNYLAVVISNVTVTNIVETNATAWFTSNTGLRNRSVRVLLDDSTGIFYAGTDGGVFKSTNSGFNWSSMNKGLKSTRIRALAIDPLTPSTLYAGTSKGIHKSTDGTNWIVLTNGIGRPQINSILIDPVSSALLYAGTTNGLFLSTDAGASWTLSQSNLTTVNVATLAFASGSSGTVYAGTRGIDFIGGTNDAFLVKLAPDGLSYGYALTFGGKRNDEGWDVAVDGSGNAYVTGQTASKEFPVIGSFTTTNTAYQTNLSGKIDAFVSGFSADGGSNFLSFYHGGRKTDYGHGIALDPDGNAYIVGRTESTGLPVASQLVNINDDPLKLGGKRDAFVTKFLVAPPSMSVQPVVAASGGTSPASVSQILVSWPASAYEFRLEAREPGGAWFPVAEKPSVANGRYRVILPASSSTLLFRLRM